MPTEVGRFLILGDFFRAKTTLLPKHYQCPVLGVLRLSANPPQHTQTAPNLHDFASHGRGGSLLMCFHISTLFRPVVVCDFHLLSGPRAR